jgi:plasmid stabilization system protein ParE
VKIVWSPLAIERAHDIAAYIAQDRPEAALKWLDGLFASTDRLEKFPQSGRVVPEIGSPEYREVIFRKAYRVIYRIERSSLAILTVRNCAEEIDRTEIDSQEPAG